MENVEEVNGLSHKLKLNDGNLIPGFGLGMFLGFHTAEPDHRLSDSQKPREKLVEVETACLFALQQGYRLFDTAAVYGTETSVDKVIKQCGVKREEIFIVTKTARHGYDTCLKELETSLKNLELDYVDLYLIHSPFRGKLLDTYDALLELRKRGVVRSIGVSNFNIDILEGLRKAGKPTPAVNQIELHPYMRRKELVSYCHRNGIQIMAYSPLTKGKKLQEPEVISIAEKYNKSVAQLFIRWCVQCGFITIPKSVKKERIVENSQVFDWNISDEDMEKLNALPEETCMSHIPIFSTIPELKWEDYK